MRRPLAVLLVATALPGCASNYAIHGSTFGASPVAATGTVIVVNGGLYATVSLGATAANVLAGVGIVALLAAGNGLSPIPPPTMREDREVNEQDCTKPIASATANLKCR
jgi:hypothetical protein